MREMRILLIMLLIVVLRQNALSCKCTVNDLRTEIDLAEEILVGRLVAFSEDYQKILVLKTWKGKTKSDTVTVDRSNDFCHLRRLFPENEFFLVYLDRKGIHNCGRTSRYHYTRDVEVLDSIYKQSIWMNENQVATLSELEYRRKNVVLTDKGEIDVNNKRVVYNFEGKVRTRETLPVDQNNFYPVRYFVVATKDSIGDNACSIDYILCVKQVHQDMILGETKRKRIERKSLRLACK
jgi:hypothetical protein